MTCYICGKPCTCCTMVPVHVGKLTVEAGVCRECAAREAAQ